jgi:hypothetical protein
MTRRDVALRVTADGGCTRCSGRGIVEVVRDGRWEMGLCRCVRAEPAPAVEEVKPGPPRFKNATLRVGARGLHRQGSGGRGVMEREYLGCGDGGCVVEKPRGMHTNGGCHCLMALDMGDRVRVMKRLRALRRVEAAARSLIVAHHEEHVTFDLLLEHLGAALESTGRGDVRRARRPGDPMTRRIALELGPQTTADRCGDCPHLAGASCKAFAVDVGRNGSWTSAEYRRSRACVSVEMYAAELAGEGEA